MFLPYRFLNQVRRLVFRLTVAPFFGSFGRRSTVLRPSGIEGIANIHVGDRVYVSDGSLLAAVPHTGAGRCELRIGDGCRLGRNNHLYATESVVFEDDVLTANNVYVSDNAHSFEDVDLPVRLQPIRQLAPVRIGRGSWLGQNVCVIGASIGKGCVVGSNSVVLDDVPDYTVVVGAPARPIRRHDPAQRRWERVQ